MHYYILTASLSLCAFPFVIIPLIARYKTLKYRFDREGVWIRWGLLFRREINLTYRRIQDIHLTRNLVERWMGLSKVEIQTAAGSGAAEIAIEGVLEAEKLRDYLYTKMRGAREESGGEAARLEHDPHTAGDEALSLLREIRDALRSLRPPEAGGRP